MSYATASRRTRSAIAFAAIALSACSTTEFIDPDVLSDPIDLEYQLVPSGDPEAPDGILLRWTEPSDNRITNYVIYSRGSTNANWSRRAETSSSTFHDSGIPHLQYFVASQDAAGNESDGSNVVTVDERNRLSAPPELRAVSLDRAIQLSWDEDSRTEEPDLFDYYRVYSTTASTNGVCNDANWVLEGTTVSEDFLATGLVNGASRCFTVSAVSIDGHESLWSDTWLDTPRYDSRFIFAFAHQADPTASGFRFYDVASQTIGLVTSGSRSDLDFRVDRHADGSLWLTPVRADVRIALYSNDPVIDLTSIDIAPLSGFESSAIEAVPGYAYVFAVTYPDGTHYGALRVTHATSDYMIFDWAYQSAPGNPELSRSRVTEGGSRL